MSTQAIEQDDEVEAGSQEQAASTGPSFLDMSDEEIANFDISTLSSGTSAPTEAAEPVVEATADDAQDQADESDQAETETAGAEGEQAVDGEGEAVSNVDETKAEEQTEVAPADKDKPKVEESKDSKPAEVDYKAAYEQIFKPFKANGREIEVKSVDDAVALMQMGANYNKKMAALKPNLKLMKLLENNNLLDEGKLSFLIDLDKKSPDAINKLIKDSGLNPLDLEENAGEYKRTTYAVDDREIELDSVLEDIQSSPAYTQTLEIVSNKWDGASKKVIADTPAVLKVINAHVESGIYDLIAKEVENERLFGRLNGLSDIEAYRQVGDAMNNKGLFNGLATATGSSQGKAQAAATPPKEVVVVEPKPKTGVDDGKLKDKRRAASSTTPTAATSSVKDFNPLSMSDEEFAKAAANRYA